MSTPLLERLDSYAEIPDMAWNVQHDIAEAATVLRMARQAMWAALNVIAIEDPEFAPNTVEMLKSALAALGTTEGGA